MKVILPVSSIPSGHVVTKRTGTKEYTVSRGVTMYGANERRTMEAEPGTAFIIDSTGNGNAIPDDTELVVELDSDELLELLEDRCGA